MQDQAHDYDGAFINTLYFVIILDVSRKIIYRDNLYWFMQYKTWGLDKHITINRWVQEYDGTNI